MIVLDLCSGMMPSSFAVCNSKASGCGDLEPFSVMFVPMPATPAALPGAATFMGPSRRLFSVFLALVLVRVALLSGALCGLVDPGSQMAAAATVAVFSVDDFGSEQNMLLEGEESGAVAGTLRDLSAWAVLDGMQAVGAGALAVSECDLDKKNGAAAAKHETVAGGLCGGSTLSGSGSSSVLQFVLTPHLLAS